MLCRGLPLIRTSTCVRFASSHRRTKQACGNEQWIGIIVFPTLPRPPRSLRDCVCVSVCVHVRASTASERMDQDGSLDSSSQAWHNITQQLITVGPSFAASVHDTGTSGSTPIGYHDLPWHNAASGTPTCMNQHTR